MSKLKYFVFLLAVLSSFNVSAQKPKFNKLIGVWQVNTDLVADAMLANYRFYADGSFIYRLNSYDDRGRILSAKGKYKLKGDTLLLTIKTRMERVGGDLTGGSQGFQSEELVLDGDKVVEVKQKNLQPLSFVIKWLNKKGVRGFKIQNNNYYLVSTDPHKDED